VDLNTAYPRPQLRRSDWTSLDGPWQFALDPEAASVTPGQVEWNATITVPFSPETPASGIGETGFFRACWYRRSFDAVPAERKGPGKHRRSATPGKWREELSAEAQEIAREVMGDRLAQLGYDE